MTDFTHEDARKKEPETLEEAALLTSKVTPNPKAKKRRDHILFVLLVLSGLGFLLYSFLASEKSVAAEERVDEKSGNNLTLQQNLQILARLRKDADKAQAPKDEREVHYRGNKPPLLRSHNNPEKTGLTPEILARMNAPTSFDIPERESAQNENSASLQAHTPQTLTANNANAEFLNASDDIVRVEAKRMPHPEFTLPADEMIPATLEVAVNSELPGLIRAVVNQDIYSLTGNNLLIPKGSSLSGQFNAAVIQGQSRLLFVWNRIRRPDGVIVTIGSPGTDKIGRSGMEADSIDRHFLERFGTSVLLSMLGGVSSLGGVKGQDQYNSAAQYRASIAASLQQTSSQVLEQDLVVKPVLSMHQGAEISVFVARDLDFSAVGAFRDNAYKSLRARVWSRVWK